MFCWFHKSLNGSTNYPRHLNRRIFIHLKNIGYSKLFFFLSRFTLFGWWAPKVIWLKRTTKTINRLKYKTKTCNALIKAFHLRRSLIHTCSFIFDARFIKRNVLFLFFARIKCVFNQLNSLIKQQHGLLLLIV